MADKRNIFKDRWLIEGAITTISPVHIGSGEKIPLKHKKEVECNSVVTDSKQRAYMPGPSLKGNLRTWLESNGFDTNIISQIFGSRAQKEDSVGGKAEFLDAMVDEMIKPAFKKAPSFWNENRLTGIIASVAIDRHTLSASDGKLFYYEFVPKGITFKVMVSGQNLREEEIHYLLAALEGFNAEYPVTLGASTSNGWGRFGWKLQSVKRIDAAGVKKWVEAGAPGAGYSMLPELPLEEVKKLEAEADKLIKKPANEQLRLKVKLTFDSLFLVNDPDINKTGDNKSEDYHPRRNGEGKVVLPASAARGALRSQAERIIRTLGLNACYIDDRSKSCMSIENKVDVKKLCPACKIFGGSGWQTTIKVSDFAQSNEEKLITQEFVAIDRFTGGAANKKKFNAEAVYMPELEGTITIDLKRMEPSLLGLIVLLKRDLEEGDITFGLGGSKGYGTCTAVVTEECGKGARKLTEAVVKDFR